MSYHLDLSRDGPGLLLRDIMRGEDPQIEAILTTLAALDADILVLQDLDHDPQNITLAALTEALAHRGSRYRYSFAAPPNAGLPTGHDLDGNGRTNDARDAHGYGRFRGQGGMAVLARHPIHLVADHSGFLWSEMPGGHAAGVTPAEALPVLRLHSVAAWDLRIDTDQGPLRLLTSHASAPVFDGPEDRNGLRNDDEISFWRAYLDGGLSIAPPGPRARFVVLGTFNVDPNRGEGRLSAIRALLAHGSLQDPFTGTAPNTVDWPEPTPGDLRVDYILPSRDLRVGAADVIWRDDALGLPPQTLAAASAHRPVVVEIDIGP